MARLAYIDFDPNIEAEPELVVVDENGSDEPEFQAPLGPIPEWAAEQDLPRVDPRYQGIGALCAKADRLLDAWDLFRLEDWQDTGRGYVAEVDTVEGYLARPVVFVAPQPEADYAGDPETFARQVAQEMEDAFPGRLYTAVSEYAWVWNLERFREDGFRLDLDEEETDALRRIVSSLHWNARYPEDEED